MEQIEANINVLLAKLDTALLNGWNIEAECIGLELEDELAKLGGDTIHVRTIQ